MDHQLPKWKENGMTVVLKHCTLDWDGVGVHIRKQLLYMLQFKNLHGINCSGILDQKQL